MVIGEGCKHRLAEFSSDDLKPYWNHLRGAVAKLDREQRGSCVGCRTKTQTPLNVRLLARSDTVLSKIRNCHVWPAAVAGSVIITPLICVTGPEGVLTQPRRSLRKVEVRTCRLAHCRLEEPKTDSTEVAGRRSKSSYALDRTCIRTTTVNDILEIIESEFIKRRSTKSQ